MTCDTLSKWSSKNEDLLLLWDKQQQSNPVHVCYLTYRVWQLWGSRQTLSIVSQQVLIGRDLILLIQVIYIETFKTDILFLLYYVTVTDMHISNQSSVPVSFIVLNDSHRLWVIPMVSEEKIFKSRPIRNKNCLWWPCLLMDRDKMSILYRGPSIYASYQALEGPL
jgi:hypothetical protein